MIQRIKMTEYLKRYENMNADERRVLTDRVMQWLNANKKRMLTLTKDGNARLKNVLTMGVLWDDAECIAFHEGVQLMTAFVSRGDTWLPEMLYVKSAQRAVRQVVQVLAEFVSEPEQGKAKTTAAPDTTDKTPDTTDKTPAVTAKTTDTADVPAVPVRPRHIDQYVHLLPEATQKKAASVKGLLRSLDLTRENMRILMDDSHASVFDREKYAVQADRIDRQLKTIYAEIDREWDKLVEQGRVRIDDLGNVHVVDGEQDARQANTEGLELTAEQKHRRRELRKWLIDIRRGAGKNREKRTAQWLENIREYLTLEPAAFEDRKIVEAASHFEIDINTINQNAAS